MDPHINDNEPEFHNTKDKFGNQLEIGDVVYYLYTNKIYNELRMGTVTHFTKWKIGVDGIARDYDRLAKVNGTKIPGVREN